MDAFCQSVCVCVMLYFFVMPRVACTFDLARVCISENIRVLISKINARVCISKKARVCKTY